MSSYCLSAPGDPLHAPYHDLEYGFPQREDSVLFERLVLEINQAGLSWDLMLKKRPAFQKAFRDFDIDKVARFGARDVDRLLNDPGIIRNKLKVAAAIENARRIRGLRDVHGSFAGWLDVQHPQSKEQWVKLFKRTFVFTGGEIVGEFLMSLGYLPGAHQESCPVYRKLRRIGPPWMATVKLR